MSKIFRNPMTPEQVKASQTISDAQLRKAQDALFLNLLNRVAQLESKNTSTPSNDTGGKLHIRNIK